MRSFSDYEKINCIDKHRWGSSGGGGGGGGGVGEGAEDSMQHGHVEYTLGCADFAGCIPLLEGV